jgi:dTDP-4-amino-4,6-dideoxygalactose transaminase
VKLKHLAANNARRRAHARLYDALLKDVPGVIPPQEAAYGVHVYHIYAIRVPNRDAVLKALGEKGVSCGIHYPVPLHLQDAYRSLGCGPGSFPVAERCAQEFLSLPMYPELTPEQVQAVVQELRLCLAQG